MHVSNFECTNVAASGKRNVEIDGGEGIYSQKHVIVEIKNTRVLDRKRDREKHKLTENIKNREREKKSDM